MPSAWSLIDASFPTFTGDERVRDQCNVMLNYMYMLAEGLKYELSNLNAQNFNSTALKNIQIETTADVEKQVRLILEDLEGIKNNIGNINTRLSELGEWKKSADKTIQETSDTVKNQGETLTAHGQELEKLKGVVAADGSGGATIGKEGAEIRLVGNVYINGKLVE